MSDTLPAGWVGNLAHHHTDRGPFRLVVSALSSPRGRYGWRIDTNGVGICYGDAPGHPDAATARAAVLARLAEIVGEVALAKRIRRRRRAAMRGGAHRYTGEE